MDVFFNFVKQKHRLRQDKYDVITPKWLNFAKNFINLLDGEINCAYFAPYFIQIILLLQKLCPVKLRNLYRKNAPNDSRNKG